MSKLQERRHRHDAYHREAVKRGFAARSVFKLGELDGRHRLLRPGLRVLDLGCRPGSWLQYAAAKVGARGRLVGLDRQPLDVTVPGARIVVGDVFEVTADELRANLGGFDVVLSDMAPDTSGIRSADQARSEALVERALDLAEVLLSPGGAFVAKVFQGPGLPAILRRCRASFEKVAMEKPRSSRAESIEQYIVAVGRRARAS